jgi:hypothetical protein
LYLVTKRKLVKEKIIIEGAREWGWGAKRSSLIEMGPSTHILCI